MLAVWLVILGRLFQLQILDHDTYTPISQQNSIRQEVVNPARGLVYDRNGTIIIENQPIYSITVTPANFDRSRTELLAELLERPVEEVTERINRAREYSWHRSSRLYTEVDFRIFSNIEENIWQLPGIHHQIESKRHYPLDLRAPHTLGYLQEPTREEFRQMNHLSLGDKIGRSGVEMTYENLLRGESGVEYIRVNAMGQSLGNHYGSTLNVPPVQGNNLMTTLDADLQMLAERLMDGKKGGLVALDPESGEILTMVSAPQYDLSRLSGRIESDYWAEIQRNRHTPLFNRAISSRQPPGSTFKPFMGLISMHLGLATPETQIYNPGAYYRGRPYRDLADIGNYDLEKAIVHSSNTYFFRMMDLIATRGYLNEWSRLAKDFGLGELNHVDLPHETSGIMPDSTYMNTNFGERRWGIGDLISLGVGQGMVSVSPLQMAVATSSIANGGYRVQPHLVRGVYQPDGQFERVHKERRKIEWIRQDHLDVVRKGMRGVVTTGSGRWYANLNQIEVAGKTGTAQNPHGENHGWFIAYAPFDDPKIAIAVLIENGGYGSVSAAPIAGLLIEQYLTGEISRQHVLDYVLDIRPLDGEVPEPEEDNESDGVQIETAGEAVETTESEVL